MKKIIHRNKNKTRNFFLCGYLGAFLLLDVFIALFILLASFSALSFSFFTSFHAIKRESLRTIRRIELSNSLFKERSVVFEKQGLE